MEKQIHPHPPTQLISPHRKATAWLKRNNLESRSSLTPYGAGDTVLFVEGDGTQGAAQPAQLDGSSIEPSIVTCVYLMRFLWNGPSTLIGIRQN
jgi:hypothetical protein